MPKTEDGGFLLDDSDLEPYKIPEKETHSKDTEVHTEDK